MVLNVNRDSMARVGFSPPTRVFEAAGAGSCLITDYWDGIETFFAPGIEILVAKSAAQVVAYLRGLSKADARQIGTAMHERAIREHTYAQRAAQLISILKNSYSGTPTRQASPASVYSPA
jgi:spore maturation protein CgeB